MAEGPIDEVIQDVKEKAERHARRRKEISEEDAPADQEGMPSGRR